MKWLLLALCVGGCDFRLPWDNTDAVRDHGMMAEKIVALEQRVKALEKKRSADSKNMDDCLLGAEEEGRDYLRRNGATLTRDSEGTPVWHARADVMRGSREVKQLGTAQCLASFGPR